MASPFSAGTRAVDADAARRAAEADGQRDGSRQYPPISAEQQAAIDYKGRSSLAEAHTTGSLIVAGHLVEQRAADDTALGSARSKVARGIGETRDARRQLEDGLAEARALRQQLPLSAQARFWPARLVGAVLLVLALATAAALIAALQSATEDQWWLSYLIGSGVAVAAVGGGAAVGALLRRRDLDDLEEGAYSAHTRRWRALLLCGVVGLLLTGLAIAGVRQEASEAAAVRRAQQGQITLTLPGQTPVTGTATTSDQEERAGVVSRWLWLMFELGIAAAAVTIEYQRADARTEHLEAADKAVQVAYQRWRAERQALQEAVADLGAVLMGRADRDGAANLVAAAQVQFAVSRTNTYRHSNLAARGGVGGDPWEDVRATAPAPLVTSLEHHPGTDLSDVEISPALAPEVAGASTPVPVTRVDDHDVDAGLLGASYEELAKAPERPSRAGTELWKPGGYLDLDRRARPAQGHPWGRPQDEASRAPQDARRALDMTMPAGDPGSSGSASAAQAVDVTTDDGNGSHL